MKTTIITKKESQGHYLIQVICDHKLVGTFKTTDMQLVDDIQEMKQGNEKELVMFDDFKEIENHCIKQANIQKYF